MNNQLILEHQSVKLRKLVEEDFTALARLALSPEIWQPWPANLFDEKSFKEKWFEKALKQSELERFTFAVLYNDKLVGSTSLYDIDLVHKKLKIGYTWYGKEYWGTSVNKIAKYLLLQYAFETLKCNRVGASVDSANKRSCRAIEKIGFKQEGLVRHEYIRPDGSLRDSIPYGILYEEWPAAKIGLEKLIYKE